MSRLIANSRAYFRRLAPAVLACLLLAQIAVILHRADHLVEPQDGTCALCAFGNHLSSPPSAELHVSFQAPPTESTIFSGPTFSPARHISPYFSRAPPKSL